VNLIGQQLGSYRVSRLIGRGGFAKVYLGEHCLGKMPPVAIKALQLSAMQTAEDHEKREKFLQEAQTLVQLKHEHIVQVLDCGIEKDKDIAYIIMQYASGGTLREQHPMGETLPPRKILDYIKQVASALQYAHDKRYMHLDIKPENLLIDGETDKILLSDFDAAVIARSIGSQHTQESVRGTPLYMPYEQWSGHPNRLSDQYALAVIIYEWLCGRRPFDDNTPPHERRQMPPNIRSRDQTISPVVAQVVMKALHPNPEQRYESIQAFVNAFEQAILDEISTKEAIQIPRVPEYPLADTVPIRSSNAEEANNRNHMVSDQAGQHTHFQHSTTRSKQGILMHMWMPVLALLVIVIGTIVSYTIISSTATKPQPNPVPTEQSSAIVTAQQAPDIMQGLDKTAVILEPLNNNPSPHAYRYKDSSTEKMNSGDCLLKADGYHVIAFDGAGGNSCTIIGFQQKDVTLQVVAQAAKGNTISLVVRWKYTGKSIYTYYRFLFRTDGSLRLLKGLGNGEHTDLPCGTSHSNYITGLFHDDTRKPIKIGIKAIGSQITGYVDGNLVCQYNDPEPYDEGSIGFSTDAGSEVIYHDANIWRL